MTSLATEHSDGLMLIDGDRAAGASRWPLIKAFPVVLVLSAASWLPVIAAVSALAG